MTLNVEQAEARIFSDEYTCNGIQTLCRLITVTLLENAVSTEKIQHVECTDEEIEGVIRNARTLLVKLLTGRHGSDIATYIANAITYTAMRIEEAGQK